MNTFVTLSSPLLQLCPRLLLYEFVYTKLAKTVAVMSEMIWNYLILQFNSHEYGS